MRKQYEMSEAQLKELLLTAVACSPFLGPVIMGIRDAVVQ